MKLPDDMSRIATMTFELMLLEGRVNGLGYNNSTLTGPGIVDTYDPDIYVDPLLAASYWPSGMIPDGPRYIMHNVNGHDELDMNNERIFARDFLLKASIEAPAMERYHTGISEQEKRIIQAAGTMIVPSMVEICYSKQAPLSYVIFSKVLRSDHIPEDTRVANLYYPMAMPPKASLGQLRRAVKGIIAEETL